MPNRPWGYKVTVTAYYVGPDDARLWSAFAEMTAESMADAAEGAEFVGAAVEIVKTEPADQGGS